MLGLYAACAGRRTELNIDEALLPRDPRENLGIDLHSRASISWQEGEKEASSLRAWGERVECGGDLGEVSGDHFDGLCDYKALLAWVQNRSIGAVYRLTIIAIEGEMEL